MSFDPLETIQAEQAIERLIRRFALLNDAGDFDGLAEMFTEDGSFARPTAPDQPVQGREAILQAFQSRPPRITRHLVNNVVVELQSADEATAVSYIVLYTAPPGTLPAVADPTVLVGAFRDRLRREAGRWLFVERRGSLALRSGAA